MGKTETNPIYDYSMLRGRIREKLGTEGAYASKIGRTQNYLTAVFNGRSFFSQKDITSGADVLEIEPKDIGAFYFTKKVHESGTV